jgi:hypothetical protein
MDVRFLVTTCLSAITASLPPNCMTIIDLNYVEGELKAINAFGRKSEGIL